MKCNDVRVFFSQIAQKQAVVPVSQIDLNFLANNGYLTVMQRVDYEKAAAEVSRLAQMNIDLVNTQNLERANRSVLQKDLSETHSITHLFEKKEEKAMEQNKIAEEEKAISQIDADIARRETEINELIKQKSVVDRLVPYGNLYLSLTGVGIMALNDLNVRNYRVSDLQFSDFIRETQTTYSELRYIAEKGSYHINNLRGIYPEVDPSELWGVSIGLAKLQGDPMQIGQRFLFALDLLRHFDSTFENKMMASEIMTASKPSSQEANNADLQNLSETLEKIDHQVRHEAHVANQSSVGVAATILFGRRFDGTFPTDRFLEFSKITASFESAAILSIVNVPTDFLVSKFQSFRLLFNSWGFELSEDTELAAAYLALSDLGVEDVRTKLTIIENGLRNYLEYPLVASAILASISTIEANETLNLMEKAAFMLGNIAKELERSEVVSLAVRMIHGIRNELVRQLDPTAPIAQTPIQFTYRPMGVFFIYRVPLIVVHSSYYSTFSGIGGYHPAHVHGVGGFMG
jgi:hypothetical protein